MQGGRTLSGETDLGRQAGPPPGRRTAGGDSPFGAAAAPAPTPPPRPRCSASSMDRRRSLAGSTEE